MLRVDEETNKKISVSTKTQLQAAIANTLESEKIDLIVIEDYDKGVMSEGLASFIIEQGRRHNIPVAVDPKLENFKFYKGVDLFKPNLKELREGLNNQASASDTESMIRAVESMHNAIKPVMSLTTLGADGMWAHAPTKGCEHHHQKGEQRNIVDVSGAGDTVIAVASLMLAAGASPEQATRAANISGGLVCEESGVVMINREALASELKVK
jgi:rfaE bifunctional protein kinase chain/domain